MYHSPHSLNNRHTIIKIDYIDMSNSNSSKDTVLLLSVGKPNSNQKKYSHIKRYIIRWFKGLRTLPIQKKIIFFLLFMISCYFLYPTYYNRLSEHKIKANDGLNSEDSSETKYGKIQDAAVQSLMKLNRHAEKIKKIKKKTE